MIPRFRRSRLVFGSLALIVTLPACTAPRTAAATRPVVVPKPDLCKILDRKTADAALLGKVTGCEPDSGAEYYAVRFTATSVVSHKKTAASLTVAYTARYQAKTGVDRWADFEQPHGSRVRLIGVGDMAVFDAKAAHSPQLVAVKKDLILTVALEMGGVATPQDQLPDHLLGVARAAFDAVPS
jgi:hypothetical protein